MNPRVIQYLHPDAVPLRDYTLADNGNGPEIVAWDTDVLGEQPGAETLADIESSDEFKAWLARPAKLAALDEWWRAKESAGIVPQGFSFALGIEASDVALLNGAFTLAQTAVTLGLKTSEDTFPVVDKAGEVQQLTLAQMTAALLSYGEARALLSATYAAYKSAIQSATSEEELDAITFE